MRRPTGSAVDNHAHDGVKLLRGGEQGRWRARIGDYPIVYAIADDHLIILALRVGHRREVYEH